MEARQGEAKHSRREDGGESEARERVHTCTKEDVGSATPSDSRLYVTCAQYRRSERPADRRVSVE